jgi:hypothetical protein
MAELDETQGFQMEMLTQLVETEAILVENQDRQKTIESQGNKAQHTRHLDLAEYCSPDKRAVPQAGITLISMPDNS